MKITAGITQKNTVHTRLSVWVNGGLIVQPGGICLRNEEVAPFLQRLAPDQIYDQRVFFEADVLQFPDDTGPDMRAIELGIPAGYSRVWEHPEQSWQKDPGDE